MSTSLQIKVATLIAYLLASTAIQILPPDAKAPAAVASAVGAFA
ncbi:hypothetical protein AAKU55_002883 [Oxalobacteraceae bacterium GrIS 1.11]